MNWTLNKASQEFGIDRKTLAKRLIRLGITVKERAEYPTKTILRCCLGDLNFERTRRERAEADRSETKAAAEKGVLIHHDEVADLIRKTFGPVRERVIALPKSMSARCNPSDPQHAEKILEEWTDNFLKEVKEHLPKPQKDERTREN